MGDETRSGTVGDESPYDGVSVTMSGGNVTTVLYRDPMAVSYTDIFRVGTLELRIKDAKTKKVIWQGAAQAKLVDNATVDQRKQRLKAAIHRILDRFPPK